ncbi:MULTISPECIES: DUF2505 domain-containing protein [unclassified Gordonia (in: high G+C Gram-positive bacteria)]|uniref:DUF2505 domain-containing protein n=1 Tax=unclassified Gordonia (in: high G+C Gram-positive bacteria) TaxID=2657482 RepID=UPI001FFFED03|nr:MULTISPECIES: DUF2505 domain-containing protein [unclassified Gordonia (in: high G+C Gram-positive bacteria)]UQE74724.1 DUF2505 domain-containing protein [Gordonia sp. PP30]
MASNFEYSVSYPFGVAELWALISTEQYWHDLIERTNSELGSVQSFLLDENKVTVTTKQGVAPAELPSVVTAILPGGVEIPRTIDFVLAGDQLIGQMEASVSGQPAKIHGDVMVMGAPATATYDGSCAVSIPFVGGKIEKAIIDQLRHLLDAERDATLEIAEK